MCCLSVFWVPILWVGSQRFHLKPWTLGARNQNCELRVWGLEFNIGVFLIRIWLWGPIYYNDNKGHPEKYCLFFRAYGWELF